MARRGAARRGLVGSDEESGGSDTRLDEQGADRFAKLSRASQNFCWSPTENEVPMFVPLIWSRMPTK